MPPVEHPQGTPHWKAMIAGLVASACVLGLAAYGFESGVVQRFTDTEAEFDGQHTPLEDMIEYAPETATYLPPIPEPLLGGRTRWSEYWRDMSPEEERVYGTLPPQSGPPRVGVQAGHWRTAEVPEELAGLRASSGARGGGHTEQEAVLEIARRVKEILEAEGIIVDLLPATIPVDYVADAFVSIHADGATSGKVNGFKISGPRRDFSGKAERLVEELYAHYGSATGIAEEDESITRRMSAYYAFNWRRYDHALHPQTPAAIVETGYITSAEDRRVIVEQPQLAAEGIASGILAFLKDE